MEEGFILEGPFNAVHPTPFFGIRRVNRGEGLGKTPESLIVTRAVFKEESFQSLKG